MVICNYICYAQYFQTFVRYCKKKNLKNNNITIFVVWLIVLILPSSGFAQESQGGSPRSLTIEPGITDIIPTLYFAPPSEDEIKEAINYNNSSSESLQFAVGFDTQIDIRESAHKDSLEDGILYRIAIVSRGATSIRILFSTYNIPHGATVFVYNEYDILGAFTSYNNSKSNKLPVMPLKGDSLVIEYFEPYFLPTNENGLVVGEVYHGILDEETYNRYTDCQININCPDGDEWQKEKRAVCKLIFDRYLCSGTLLNNTKSDGKPYVLTANHCISTQDIADECIFVFNYESPTCSTASSVLYQSIAGGILRATNQNSDFTLIELNRRIPSRYHPYFAGWSRLIQHPESGVCIHHPRGNVKKISTYNLIPVTSDCMSDSYNPANFWIIKRWYHGVTEGGSSGSALFNAKHRVIGQLYGGCPGYNNNCDNIEREYSNYGKFDVSWNYGNTPSKRLKDWLDPINSDAIELEPLESCDTMVSVSLTLYDGIAGMEDYMATEDIQTYQNVASGQTINFTAGREIVFKDGFVAEYGSEVSALITPFDCVVSCPGINVEQWTNYGHIGGSIDYHVLNANYYEYTVYSQIGQLVYHSEGTITSDIVEVWSNINFTGIFFHTIVFISNCGDTVSKTGILSLSSSKSLQTNTNESNVLKEVNAADSKVQIYPNPASNTINIIVESPLPYSIKMYDTKGAVVLQWDYLTVDRLVLNANNLNSGVYYLGVQSGAKFITKKIVIQ